MGMIPNGIIAMAWRLLSNLRISKLSTEFAALTGCHQRQHSSAVLHAKLPVSPLESQFDRIPSALERFGDFLLIQPGRYVPQDFVLVGRQPGTMHLAGQFSEAMFRECQSLG
jgi:hypothetical protein